MSIHSSLFLLKLVLTNCVIASISVVDKGVLPLVENSVGIRFYIDITNKDRQGTCILHSRSKKCCLSDINKEDCDMLINDDIVMLINSRDRKTLLYVAPMLQQHDLIGYCDFTLNSKCSNTKRNIEVTIPFDTRVDVKSSKALMEQYTRSKKVASCDTLDEDSLNNCHPVNCDIKYLDKRPVYDHVLNKCVEVPVCPTDANKDLPDYVYVPNSNTCRNLDYPLTLQDIYAITSGLGVVTTSPASTVDMKVEVKSNCSTVSQNVNFLIDLMFGRLCPMVDGHVADFSGCFKSAILSIAICILSVCGVLFGIIFCLNSAVWLYLQWSKGNIDKMGKSVKSFFSRRNMRKCEKEQVRSTIRNALLRDVMIKDIPLELRNSAIDVCDRIGREVGNKRRYRISDLGSQISLQNKGCYISIYSSSSSDNE